VARSSKPRRPRQQLPPFVLQLTAGGDAELIDPFDGETVWRSREDEDFREEFPGFLTPADLFDILDFLEEVGELTAREADQCECVEQFLTPADLTGFIPAE
jgi:hypothetical protein